MISHELKEWCDDPSKSTLFHVDEQHWFHQNWSPGNVLYPEGDPGMRDVYSEVAAETNNLYFASNERGYIKSNRGARRPQQERTP